MAHETANSTNGAAASVSCETLEARFDRLAEQWKRDTRFTSSLSKVHCHPAYQEIISMGQPALRLILAALSKEPDHWFAALEALTGENPVPPEDAGDLEKMRAVWLRWAAQRNLL